MLYLNKMLCSNCLKLSLLTGKRSCVRCQSEIHNNLAVLCERCSETSKSCAICLKKVLGNINKLKSGGCSVCGKKK